MKLEFKSKKLQNICTNASVAEKEYGSRMAELIHQRIDEITAADTVEMLLKFRVGRCHALKGNLHGKYAMDLAHPFRLIFIKKGVEIQVVKIVDIADYH